jgi:hypothetical protein
MTRPLALAADRSWSPGERALVTTERGESLMTLSRGFVWIGEGDSVRMGAQIALRPVLAAQPDPLREAVAALADEWDAEGDMDMWAPGPAFAAELRDVLAAHPDSGTP